jgi:heterodisulfide reductase subunit B2
MSKYLFYPGCSLQRSARPYLDSLVAIQPEMEMELEEISDWNCCGATEYGAVFSVARHALVARNLARASEQVNGAPPTVVAPCSACYLNLNKTDHVLRTDKRMAAFVNDALHAGGLDYRPGSIASRHLLDVVYNDVGLDAIRRKVVNPLTGLRVAPYYGCMIVRPDVDNHFSSTEYPHELDELLAALGATVIDFPLKSHCCGGHMTQISPQVAYEMIRRLVSGADNYHADIMVTLCPMCQLNLDAYQADMNNYFKTSYHMPVLYFTQLMGLAFGHDPLELGLGTEFVSARDALARIGVELPAEEPVAAKPAARRKDDPSLPMPKPLDGGPKGEEKGS